MDNTTKWIVFIFFLLGAFWDAITTFGGVSSITKGGLFSFVLTIFINGILALTFLPLKKNDFIGFFSGIMWLTAVGGDLTTSFYGNWRVSELQSPTQLQYFLIGISAIFTSGSTIAFSYIVFKEDVFGFYGTKK
jgi:hypothetical protein